MNRHNNKEPAVFSYCKFSLFLKDPLFPDYLEVARVSFSYMGLVKLLPVHQYSIDILSYSGPSGILCFEGRIPITPVLGDMRFVAFSINSHEQTQ